MGSPAAPPLSPDAGPTDSHLPTLPSGWIAQWDSRTAADIPDYGSSRKYYYVQISTGVSQWDLPTSEAPAGPSRRPEQIPASVCESAGIPDPAGQSNSQVDEYSSDRGLGSTAIKLLASQHDGGRKSSGLGSLASSLLNSSAHGGGSHSGGHSSGAAGLAGSLVTNLLGGSKTNGQPQAGLGSSFGSHQTSSPGGVLGGILGGVGHGSQITDNYGYSSGAPISGGYSGTAPPIRYNPSSGPAAQTPAPGSSYPGRPGYSEYPSNGQYMSAAQQTAPFATQNSPSWPLQAQNAPSFPPPPTQAQHPQTGGFGTIPGSLAPSGGGYFGQGHPHGAYGQPGCSESNQFPPPPTEARPHGAYNPAPSYGQASPSWAYGQSHSQGTFSAGYDGQTSGGHQATYGNGQYQPRPTSSGAPYLPGW